MALPAPGVGEVTGPTDGPKVWTRRRPYRPLKGDLNRLTDDPIALPAPGVGKVTGQIGFRGHNQPKGRGMGVKEMSGFSRGDFLVLI